VGCARTDPVSHRHRISEINKIPSQFHEQQYKYVIAGSIRPLRASIYDDIWGKTWTTKKNLASNSGEIRNQHMQMQFSMLPIAVPFN
jgi:hypothetical protein